MDTILPIPTDRPTDHALRALGPAIRRIRGALRHRAGPDRRPSAALVRSIVDEIAAVEPAAGRWTATLIRGGDPAVLALGPAGSEPAAVLRIARTATTGLVTAERAQTFARAVMNAGGAVVPQVVASGTTDGSLWLAERALPGDPGRTRMADPASRTRAVAAVAAAIAPLHAASDRRPGEELTDWVAHAARLVGTLVGDVEAWGSRQAEVVAELGHHVLPMSWVHGDLWLENARFASGADRVTALVDWDSAAPDRLGLQDLVHLAITTRRRAERRDFGPMLLDALQASDRAPSLRSLLGAAGDDGVDDPALDAPIAPELPPATTLLLAWLRFVEVNVARHPELGRDARWVEANVRRVVAWR